MSGRAIVLRADAGAMPLPDACVDLIVTSPPFYALRSYTDGGVHYAEQIGSEATPAEYIANLVDCTREWMRVLKPSGSMFVDLGDKYAQDTERSRNGLSGSLAGTNPLRTGPVYAGRRENGLPRKSLMLLPERYRIACVDELGLICRAVIVWHKPNGLPESVTDRVRRAHEDWVHLVKAPRYYSAVDEIREGYAPGTAMRYAAGYNVSKRSAAGATSSAALLSIARGDGGPSDTNPLGKLPGSVWQISSEPLVVPARLGVDHFAAFPTEWPRRLILGWSPPGICTECGEGRRPLSVVGRAVGHGDGQHRPGAIQLADGAAVTGQSMISKWSSSHTITGYVCACTPYTDHPERRQPSVTPSRSKGRGHQDNDLRAGVLGSRHHGDDWPVRADDPSERARALRVPRPEPIPQNQLELFGEAS